MKTMELSNGDVVYDTIDSFKKIILINGFEDLGGIINVYMSLIVHNIDKKPKISLSECIQVYPDKIKHLKYKTIDVFNYLSNMVGEDVAADEYLSVGDIIKIKGDLFCENRYSLNSPAERRKLEKAILFIVPPEINYSSQHFDCVSIDSKGNTSVYRRCNLWHTKNSGAVLQRRISTEKLVDFLLPK